MTARTERRTSEVRLQADLCEVRLYGAVQTKFAASSVLPVPE